MPAVSFVAADVGVDSQVASATYISVVQVGEAVSHGQVGYQDGTNKKYYKADSNGAAATNAAASVFFLSAASADGYALVAKTGAKVKAGVVFTKGQLYCVGSTAGAVVPFSDLTTGDYVTIVGVADSTSTIPLNFLATGVQK
jgi:hypothetical protein